MAESSTTWLTCCCCGKRTVGRQWKHRIKGEGVCTPCAEAAPVEDRYGRFGVRGEHWALNWWPTRKPSARKSAPKRCKECGALCLNLNAASTCLECVVTEGVE